MTRHDQAFGPTTRHRHFDPPLTIGLISDTHIYTGSARVIPPEVLRLFQRADVGLIVHMGDANSRSVLEELAEIAPLIAVPGNNDDDELQYTLPQTTRFDVGPHGFGVIHGHGGRSAREEALKRWRGKVPYVFFGHSHKPLIERVGETVLINPGSPTDKRWFPHFGIGLIRVTTERVWPDLILFEDAAHLDHVDVSPIIGEP